MKKINEYIIKVNAQNTIYNNLTNGTFKIDVTDKLISNAPSDYLMRLDTVTILSNNVSTKYSAKYDIDESKYSIRFKNYVLSNDSEFNKDIITFNNFSLSSYVPLRGNDSITEFSVGVYYNRFSLARMKERFFPAFYNDNNQNLVDFFSYYLEWLELPNNEYASYFSLSKVIDYTVVDDSVEKYLLYIKNDIMPNIDIEYYTERELKNKLKNLLFGIYDSYRKKGTFDSLNYFMTVLYGTQATLFYPSANVLKPSDGEWNSNYCLSFRGNDVYKNVENDRAFIGSELYRMNTWTFNNSYNFPVSSYNKFTDYSLEPEDYLVYVNDTTESQEGTLINVEDYTINDNYIHFSDNTTKLQENNQERLVVDRKRITIKHKKEEWTTSTTYNVYPEGSNGPIIDTSLPSTDINDYIVLCSSGTSFDKVDNDNIVSIGGNGIKFTKKYIHGDGNYLGYIGSILKKIKVLYISDNNKIELVGETGVSSYVLDADENNIITSVNEELVTLINGKEVTYTLSVSNSVYSITFSANISNNDHIEIIKPVNIFYYDIDSVLNTNVINDVTTVYSIIETNENAVNFTDDISDNNISLYYNNVLYGAGVVVSNYYSNGNYYFFTKLGSNTETKIERSKIRDTYRYIVYITDTEKELIILNDSSVTNFNSSLISLKYTNGNIVTVYDVENTGTQSTHYLCNPTTSNYTTYYDKFILDDTTNPLISNNTNDYIIYYGADTLNNKKKYGTQIFDTNKNIIISKEERCIYLKKTYDSVNDVYTRSTVFPINVIYSDSLWTWYRSVNNPNNEYKIFNVSNSILSSNNDVYNVTVNGVTVNDFSINPIENKITINETHNTILPLIVKEKNKQYDGVIKNIVEKTNENIVYSVGDSNKDYSIGEYVYVKHGNVYSLHTPNNSLINSTLNSSSSNSYILFVDDNYIHHNLYSIVIDDVIDDSKYECDEFNDIIIGYEHNNVITNKIKIDSDIVSKNFDDIKMYECDNYVIIEYMYGSAEYIDNDNNPISHIVLNNTFSDTNKNNYIIMKDGVLLSNNEFSIGTYNGLIKIEFVFTPQSDSLYEVRHKGNLIGEATKIEYDEYVVQDIRSINTGWKNTKGFISTKEINIQDMDYYNNYTYVITSDISLSYYKKVLDNIVHPAGLKYYTKYDSSINGIPLYNYENSDIYPVNETNNNAVTINVYNKDVLFWDDDYEKTKMTSDWRNTVDSCNYNYMRNRLYKRHERIINKSGHNHYTLDNIDFPTTDTAKYEITVYNSGTNSTVKLDTDQYFINGKDIWFIDDNKTINTTITSVTKELISYTFDNGHKLQTIDVNDYKVYMNDVLLTYDTNYEVFSVISLTDYIIIFYENKFKVIMKYNAMDVFDKEIKVVVNLPDNTIKTYTINSANYTVEQARLTCNIDTTNVSSQNRLSSSSSLLIKTQNGIIGKNESGVSKNYTYTRGSGTTDTIDVYYYLNYNDVIIPNVNDTLSVFSIMEEPILLNENKDNNGKYSNILIKYNGYIHKVESYDMYDIITRYKYTFSNIMNSSDFSCYDDNNKLFEYDSTEGDSRVDTTNNQIILNNEANGNITIKYDDEYISGNEYCENVSDSVVYKYQFTNLPSFTNYRTIVSAKDVDYISQNKFHVIKNGTTELLCCDTDGTYILQYRYKVDTSNSSSRIGLFVQGNNTILSINPYYVVLDDDSYLSGSSLYNTTETEISYNTSGRYIYVTSLPDEGSYELRYTVNDVVKTHIVDEFIPNILNIENTSTLVYSFLVPSDVIFDSNTKLYKKTYSLLSGWEVESHIVSGSEKTILYFLDERSIPTNICFIKDILVTGSELLRTNEKITYSYILGLAYYSYNLNVPFYVTNGNSLYNLYKITDKEVTGYNRTENVLTFEHSLSSNKRYNMNYCIINSSYKANNFKLTVKYEQDSISTERKVSYVYKFPSMINGILSGSDYYISVSDYITNDIGNNVTEVITDKRPLDDNKAYILYNSTEIETTKDTITSKKYTFSSLSGIHGKACIVTHDPENANGIGELIPDNKYFIDGDTIFVYDSTYVRPITVKPITRIIETEKYYNNVNFDVNYEEVKENNVVTGHKFKFLILNGQLSEILSSDYEILDSYGNIISSYTIYYDQNNSLGKRKGNDIEYYKEVYITVPSTVNTDIIIRIYGDEIHSVSSTNSTLYVYRLSTDNIDPIYDVCDVYTKTGSTRNYINFSDYKYYPMYPVVSNGSITGYRNSIVITNNISGKVYAWFRKKTWFYYNKMITENSLIFELNHTNSYTFYETPDQKMMNMDFGVVHNYVDLCPSDYQQYTYDAFTIWFDKNGNIIVPNYQTGTIQNINQNDYSKYISVTLDSLCRTLRYYYEDFSFTGNYVELILPEYMDTKYGDVSFMVFVDNILVDSEYITTIVNGNTIHKIRFLNNNYGVNIPKEVMIYLYRTNILRKVTKSNYYGETLTVTGLYSKEAERRILPFINGKCAYYDMTVYDSNKDDINVAKRDNIFLDSLNNIAENTSVIVKNQDNETWTTANKKLTDIKTNISFSKYGELVYYVFDKDVITDCNFSKNKVTNNTYDTYLENHNTYKRTYTETDIYKVRDLGLSISHSPTDKIFTFVDQNRTTDNGYNIWIKDVLNVGNDTLDYLVKRDKVKFYTNEQSYVKFYDGTYVSKDSTKYNGIYALVSVNSENVVLDITEHLTGSYGISEQNGIIVEEQEGTDIQYVIRNGIEDKKVCLYSFGGLFKSDIPTKYESNEIISDIKFLEVEALRIPTTSNKYDEFMVSEVGNQLKFSTIGYKVSSVFHTNDIETDTTYYILLKDSSGNSVIVSDDYINYPQTTVVYLDNGVLKMLGNNTTNNPTFTLATIFSLPVSDVENDITHIANKRTLKQLVSGNDNLSSYTEKFVINNGKYTISTTATEYYTINDIKTMKGICDAYIKYQSIPVVNQSENVVVVKLENGYNSSLPTTGTYTLKIEEIR